MKIEFRDYVKHPLTEAEITTMIREGKRMSVHEFTRLRRILGIVKSGRRKGAKGMHCG